MLHSDIATEREARDAAETETAELDAWSQLAESGYAPPKPRYLAREGLLLIVSSATGSWGWAVYDRDTGRALAGRRHFAMSPFDAAEEGLRELERRLAGGA
jgi:hypothetical protein